MSAPTTPTTTSPAPAGRQPADAASVEQPANDPEAPAGGGDGERAEGTPGEDASSGSHDLGGESKSDTDQSGGESDRHEFRRAAWNVFGGDRVGRDKFVFYLSSGQPSPPPRRLSSILSDYARRAFVSPEGWDRCRNDFRDRHTVMLRGVPGQGRATMAIRLLQTVESREIFELDPQIDLTRMAEQLIAQPLASGTAFLLHEPHDIARLTAYTLRSIEDALTMANARLVVTVGSEVSFQDEDLLRYQLGLPAAPERRAILIQHLNHLVGEQRAEQIMDDPEVAALVVEKLGGADVPCKKAADLAVLLSRTPDPIDVTEVARLLQRHSTDEFDMWFESLDTVKLRCFAVALAVLNGLPYEDVADAARRLGERVSSGGRIVLGEGSVLRMAGSDPFEPSQAQLLHRLQAVTKQGTTRTPYGHAPATMVAYRNSEYPRQVIERAWKSYQLEEKLLAWLADLVTAGSPQVRAYAGTALGVVATLAFEYVRPRVLSPWAHDRSLWKNEAVADALRVAADVPELQAGATWLVNTWYGAEQADAQCTAALALGTRLGRPDATRSVQDLERLAMVDEPSVRVGVARGFASLLADDPDLTPQLYQVVDRCLADPDRTYTGQYLFLFVAEDVHTDIATGDDDPIRWPALLHLAQQREELRGPLFQCWARVLTEGPALAMAQRVLRTWAGRAEANLGVRVSFTRMVRAVALLDARAGAVVARCAKQWNSDEQLRPLPAAALAVSSVISS